MSFISRILNIGPICSKRVLVLKKKKGNFLCESRPGWREGTSVFSHVALTLKIRLI